MGRAAQIGRLLRITQIFVRHDLDEFVRVLHLFRPYRLALRLMPWRWFRGKRVPRAQRLREALEELGPVFVKFGQMLSTRPDLLPEDIAEELNRLQDQVPPFAGEQALAVIEQAYGDRIDRHLRAFDPVPVASASVAQVHFAELLDGTPIAVKVLRPGIEAVIERDLALLYALARLAQRYWPEARRMRPEEVVDEYSKTIHAELDLMHEAANASQLRANFAASEILHVPKVYWDLTRTTVMVMERISGIPISNIQALKDAGIDLRRLAHNGVEIFFTQAFRDGFFHADMHPGNIFVSPAGQYLAVDFGIMGTLSDRDKYFLAENFLGFFRRDYRAIAESHVHAGWVAGDTRMDEFEAAIRAVCEPIFARPLKDISFGRLLLRLFQTARRFNMEVQPQLVLLQKTVFNIEGLGRRLYPDLDLWQTAKPFLERWMRNQVGPRALLRNLVRELPKWSHMLPELPALFYDTLRRRVDIEARQETAQIERLRRDMARTQRRIALLMSAGGFLLAAVVIYLTGKPAWGWLGIPLAGWLLGVTGAGLLFSAWLRGRAS
ncbi:MAG: ubiquinone biosynthesis regulatory protein kinase UbiB [Acidiferrobacterales bacterium]